jgi:integrase
MTAIWTPQTVRSWLRSLGGGLRLWHVHGLRRFCELVALRLDRLDLRVAGFVSTKSWSRLATSSGESPRPGAPGRWVTVPGFVAFAVAEHVRLYPRGPHGLVLTAPKGGPIGRPAFYRLVWHKATKAPGLEKFPLRNLRHTGGPDGPRKG